jgi:EAL domain-containing protein (putative c-di-GMP-specific phosphodiesterase class I)
MAAPLTACVVEFPERARLFEIFGPAAVEQALADFGTMIDRLFDQLLARHAVVERRHDAADGRWAVYFRLELDQYLHSEEEVRASIEEAGRWLLPDMVNAVFGAGSGMRIPVRLDVLPGVGVDGGLPRAPDSGYSSMDEQQQAAESIADVLASREIQTYLQPIVRLADRAVVGYEALSRGPQGSALERPDRLFAAAHLAGRSRELELLCAELALERTRGRLPPGRFLTVNLGPEALAAAPTSLDVAGCPELMFELTEHLPLNEAEALQRTAETLRRQAVQLVLDDTGCGFADFDTARILCPDIVKLCITVIRNADKGLPFLGAIRETVEQLGELGCRVLAEGVESEAQHAALSGCGIELAQGWLYGKPAPWNAAL